MYSMIITVQSIVMIANFAIEHLLKQYETQTESQFEQNADYSIPSLIWPPPKLLFLCVDATSAQLAISTLLSGGVYHD